MKDILIIVQIVISVVLLGTILLQAQGTGLGSTWGGGGESYRSKRGVERILFIFTITLTALFLVLAIVNLSLV